MPCARGEPGKFFPSEQYGVYQLKTEQINRETLFLACTLYLKDLIFPSSWRPINLASHPLYLPKNTRGLATAEEPGESRPDTGASWGGTVLHRPRHGTARHSPVQPGTARYSPVQPGTARYSPVQPGTALRGGERARPGAHGRPHHGRSRQARFPDGC